MSGESTPRRLGARIIAATNADLHDAILQGKLREDFYYRLRVVPIHIPPLRERPVDIELIARHLLARIGGREGRALRLSSDTLSVLETFPWPGNVRELENALEYAVAVCRGQTIHVEDLPIEIQTARRAPGQVVPAAEPAILPLPVGGEVQRIRTALERNMWNRSKTARELGMSRSTLWHKMRELRIGPSAG